MKLFLEEHEQFSHQAGQTVWEFTEQYLLSKIKAISLRV